MLPRTLLRPVAWLALGPIVLAQTNTPEVEPNETKAAATPTAACLLPTDTLTGHSTGSSTTTPGAGSADTWKVTVCSGPVGIYRNRLTLTSAITGHGCTLRGLSQTSGAPNPGTDSTMQTASTTSSPPRYVQWYGFGKGESMYYRVTGSASTTADYTATFSQAAVAPTVVPGSFLAGPIQVTTVGQGHATDTEVYVYDANLDPVPTFHNDDDGPAMAGLQSEVTRTLSSGIYYVAIGRYNLCNDQGDANPDEDFLSGILLDFPGALAESSTTTGSALTFTISDGVTMTQVTPATTSLFGVEWIEFTVGTPFAFDAFCAGDGLDPDVTTACPCGNFGAVGRGCANSVNAGGGVLGATGAPNPDTVVLQGSGMPGTVACIYLQGDMLTDVVFGDGVRCAGGTLIRLRTKINSGGASQFPDSTDTVTVSQRGMVTPGSGAQRYYQTYYRNAAAAFCPPATFNVTNGWKIDW